MLSWPAGATAGSVREGAEDGVEVPGLVAREEEVVMRQAVVDPVHAKVDDESRAGRLEPAEAAQRGGRHVEQASIGRDDLHVADDPVRRVERAAGPHAAHAPPLLDDFRHLAVEPDVDAEFAEQPLESAREGVHAAVDVPEAEAELDVRHQVHEGRRAHGRRSDVLDEEIEDVLQVALGQPAPHGAVHRAREVEVEDAQPIVAEQGAERVDPLAEVAPLDGVVLLAAVGEEVAERRLEVRSQLGELGPHPVVVGIEVDDFAVLEEVAPVRGDRAQRDVVVEALPGSREEIAEDLRQRHDRGAEVEAEAVALEYVELAAQLRILLEQGHRVARGRQRGGGGEAAEAGAHDGHATAGFGWGFRVHGHLEIMSAAMRPDW